MAAGLIRAAGAAPPLEPRRGYGFPCLTGARAAAAAGAQVIVFLEADGTDDPSQVRHLVRPVLAGVADLVIGSRRRAVRGAATPHAAAPAARQRLAGAEPAGWSFGLRLSDDGPFRAVRTDLLQRLRLEERAYAFPTEMAVKSRLAGARIAIRDTRYRQRAGTSKIAGTWRGSARAGARHHLVPAASGPVRLSRAACWAGV